MLQDAAKADLEILAKKSGKKEVIFPVGIPDQGTFSFLDGFLETNHGYMELSDRAIVSWARNSGFWPAKSQHYSSNDRPSLDFGNRDLEELTLRKSIASASSYYERSYVVMEVKGNLLAEERKKALAKWDSNTFKKVAVVAMGEPPREFKAKVHEEMLTHKKWIAGIEAKKKKEAEDKARAAKKAKAAREKAKMEKEANAAKEKQAEAKKKKEAEEKNKKEADDEMVEMALAGEIDLEEVAEAETGRSEEKEGSRREEQ